MAARHDKASFLVIPREPFGLTDNFNPINRVPDIPLCSQRNNEISEFNLKKSGRNYPLGPFDGQIILLTGQIGRSTDHWRRQIAPIQTIVRPATLSNRESFV